MPTGAITRPPGRMDAPLCRCAGRMPAAAEYVCAPHMHASGSRAASRPWMLVRVTICEEIPMWKRYCKIGQDVCKFTKKVFGKKITSAVIFSCSQGLSRIPRYCTLYQGMPLTTPFSVKAHTDDAPVVLRILWHVKC